MANLTDAVAASIVSGQIGAALHRGLTWTPMNLRRNGMPTKIEDRARVEARSDDAFELVMRLHPDKPWTPTCILLHKASGSNVRRLDLRGTHLDRASGHQWINQTHKHRWSEARGNADVYTPDDIRHAPAVPNVSEMKDLASEFQ